MSQHNAFEFYFTLIFAELRVNGHSTLGAPCRNAWEICVIILHRLSLFPRDVIFPEL